MTPPPTSDAENATFSRKCYRSITQRGRRGHDRALQSVRDKHQFAGASRYVHFESGEAVMRRFAPRAHGAYCENSEPNARKSPRRVRAVMHRGQV